MNPFPHNLTLIAETLVKYCNEGNEAKGLTELYHKDCESIEACSFSPDMPAKIKGVDAIRDKHEWWYSSFDVHETSAEGPFLHGDDSFAVIFHADVTEKATGERTKMHEVAIYTVENSKIVKEQFYYSM